MHYFQLFLLDYQSYYFLPNPDLFTDQLTMTEQGDLLVFAETKASMAEIKAQHFIKTKQGQNS